MITRRDKLLLQPWQQRRYENHLRKVQSALPAIDNHPPASRNHVAIKSKRKQSENERCTRIERDNLILLQKLNHITRTNRIDNNWTTPQPNFLNRVVMCKTPSKKQITETEKSQDLPLKDKRSRKEKCYACTRRQLPEPPIPEQRVPWELERPSIRRVRSKSVPTRAVTLPTVKEASSTPEKNEPQKQRSKTCKPKMNKQYSANEDANIKSPQSIILSRGSLVLSVNFPSDTFVKFREGTTEKLIMQGVCHCKNVSSKLY